MSDRVIFTNVFRVRFPHLAEPYLGERSKPTDTPKYQLQAMFPQSGICPINGQPSSIDNINQALNEVTMEEWGLDFTTATGEGMGINFPPKFRNGNLVFQVDAQKNVIPNSIQAETKDMWLISMKNQDGVGVVDPTGQVELDPNAIYFGCWARAQIQVSAYTGNYGRVVQIKLLNVQLCYDDEKLGSVAPHQSATQAFSKMTVVDSNVIPPTPFNAAPVAPAAPAAPVAPAAPANTDPVIMNEGELSYSVYVGAGWTADQLVEQGKAKPNYNNPQVK